MSDVDPLTTALDPEAFRDLGHRVIELLADYLATAARGEPPVLPWVEPSEQASRWPVDASGGADPHELLRRYVSAANHLHHPRYVGHQVTSALPLAALGSLVGALLNSVPVVYEMGPAGTAIEQALVHWLAARLGWGADADGVLTSGGSLGNLTALLACRQAGAGYDVWTDGEAGGPPFALLCGAQSHYSVARALQVMGLGRAGLVTVPVDDEHRMRADRLDHAYRLAEAEGRKVIGVVASSCSTATGTFDPLEPIGAFCRERGLWLHVDGAHGAAAALSPKYRHLLAGIEHADSVCWDAHKMMLMPAVCTAVLYREGRRSYEAFAQEASYLLHLRDPRDEWYNLCGRTFECTKVSLGLPLYLALAVYGERFFADYVTSRFDLGRRFGEMLAAERDFELPVRPDANVVCFRYLGAPADRLDALQAQIRHAILRDGSFYLVQTKLPTGLYLRVTIIHPATTEDDLAALLAAVRAAGSRIVAG